MKKKELLKEIMGVPKALTPWVNSLSQLIYDDVSKLDDWDEEGPVSYKNKDGELVEDLAVRMDEKTIKGKDVMENLARINGFADLKEFVNSEMFQNLPFWRPTITYRVVGVPTELYKLEGDGRYNAAIGTRESQGLSKIGKLRVLPNVHMHFDILVDMNDPLNRLKENLSDTIAHELLHGYQKVKQLQGGKPAHFGKETSLNAIIHNPVMNKISSDWWQNFLHLVYLHLSFEINARITQLYYYLQNKEINTKEDFLRELKKSDIWREMKRLEEFDAEEYLKSFKLPSLEGVQNPFEMVDVLAQKVMLQKQKIDVENEESALKSMIDLWDNMLDIGNKLMKQQNIGITMDNVPKSAKEDPMKFFKFFEKRFHKKAEKWKRKLYRIGSLILQEKKEALQKNK
jgi:hypothetical protein